MADVRTSTSQPEPLPRPFGVVWEAFWKLRRERGENAVASLVRSFFDTRAVS